MTFRLKTVLFVLIMVGFLVQCIQKDQLPQSDDDNGGLFLPSNFEAKVVVDSLEEKARHITVDDNGAIYVNLRYTEKGKSIAVLQDTTFDGRADIIEKFGSSSKGFFEEKGSYSTAVRIYNGYLYFSSELVVYRYQLTEGSLIPKGEPEIIMTDDHDHGKHQHIGKPIAFDDKGYMYVPFGGPSNACQEMGRTPMSPGIDPCPQLENHGGNMEI